MVVVGVVVFDFLVDLGYLFGDGVGVIGVFDDGGFVFGDYDFVGFV